MSGGQPRNLALVGLVARREIRERGGTRSFQVSTAITLVIVLAAIIVPSFFGGDDGPTRWDLAIIGTTPDGFDAALDSAAAAQGAEIDVVHLPEDSDPDTAAQDVDAVLVHSHELVADQTPPDGLQAAVTVAVGQAQLVEQLSDAGLTPEQAASAINTQPVDVRTIETDDDNGAQEAAALIGIIALFIAINTYGAWVLSGVLEEKSSRVVEVIVSAIPARTLLAGKVLGIGTLGIGQLLLTAVVGLGAAVIFDVTDVPLELLPAFASVVVWFVLGFAFYAVAYAAAGSLISRQEDVQSAAGPLTFVLLAAYFISLGVVGPNPTSLASKIISFIPFSSPMAMPPRIAQGAAAPWEIAVSIGAIVVGTWLMVRLAARIYEQGLLRTGAPIKLWTAIREARARRSEPSAA